MRYVICVYRVATRVRRWGGFGGFVETETYTRCPTSVFADWVFNVSRMSPDVSYTGLCGGLAGVLRLLLQFPVPAPVRARLPPTVRVLPSPSPASRSSTRRRVPRHSPVFPAASPPLPRAPLPRAVPRADRAAPAARARSATPCPWWWSRGPWHVRHGRVPRALVPCPVRLWRGPCPSRPRGRVLPGPPRARSPRWPRPLRPRRACRAPLAGAVVACGTALHGPRGARVLPVSSCGRVFPGPPLACVARSSQSACALASAA